jgi:hypothetical protein
MKSLQTVLILFDSTTNIILFYLFPNRKSLPCFYSPQRDSCIYARGVIATALIVVVSVTDSPFLSLRHCNIRWWCGKDKVSLSNGELVGDENFSACANIDHKNNKHTSHLMICKLTGKLLL